MPRAARLLCCLIAVALTLPPAPAQAISPQNPYRSFNLSGINYGSMQWERAQRQGKRAWPSTNTPTMPSRGYSRGVVTAGGVVAGGGVITRAGTPRSGPRVPRRFRR